MFYLKAACYIGDLHVLVVFCSLLYLLLSLCLCPPCALVSVIRACLHGSLIVLCLLATSCFTLKVVFFSFDLFWFHCLLLFLSLLWDCLCCHHCHCFSLFSFVFLSYLSLMTTNLPCFPFYLYQFLRLIVHFLNCCFILTC